MAGPSHPFEQIRTPTMGATDDDLHGRRGFRQAARGVAPASPAAIASAAAAGATPTKAEYDALRQDEVNTRTTLTNLIAALKNSGQIS